MTKFLKEIVDNSIHRETHLAMDEMEKTGKNYLFNIEFVNEANLIIKSKEPNKELLDICIVNAIYSDVIEKILKI